MTDLSITPANVLRGANSRAENGIFGATVTQGQVVYRDPADGRFKLADTDGAADARVPYGIALNAGAAGQPATVLRSGEIAIGATLVPGTTYYLSPTPGGIAPLTDVAVGDDYTVVGIAISASVLKVGFLVSGVTRAT